MLRIPIAFLLALLLPALSPAGVVPLTDETLLAVGPDSEYSLSRPAVAAQGSGFVVAWTSSFSRYRGSNLVDWGGGIEARRVDGSGQPEGALLSLVPEAHLVDLSLPALAAEAGGRYAVVWSSFPEGRRKISHWLRRFSAGGAASTLRLDQYPPTSFAPQGFRNTVALGEGGRTFAFWQRPVASRPGLLGQLVPPAGQPLPPRLQVTPRRAYQALPELGTDARGNAVLVYDNVGPAGFSAVLVRLYDRNGAPSSGELRLNPPGGTQSHPALAVHPGGRFVVAWQEGGERGRVRARLFDPPLRPAGPVFEVSERGRFPQGCDVAIGDDGTLFFTWKDNDPGDNGPQVWARAFAASGTPLGAAFRVDPDHDAPGDFGSGGTSSVAAGAGGTFLVSWTSLDSESFLTSMYSRLYGVTGASTLRAPRP